MIVGPFSENSNLKEDQQGEDVVDQYFHNIKLKFDSQV